MEIQPTDDYILLYRPDNTEKNVSVSVYKTWVSEENISELSKFIFERLFFRYLKVFTFTDSDFRKNYLSGFSIMANCCLLIETLESYYRGWPHTNGKSETAFLKFFSRDGNFSFLSNTDFPSNFYKCIRCSILHQGETSGGWKISCKKSPIPVDKTIMTIFAYRFATLLEKSLRDYEKLLIESSWESPIWSSFRKKMEEVVKNCKKPEK